MEQLKKMMEKLKEKMSRKKPAKTSNRRELTNNERVLLTLLGIVILFWLSFKFIIDPQLDSIETLEAERDAYSAQIEENNSMLKNKEAILDEKSELFEEKVNIEKDFFKTLNQPQIVYILTQLLVDNDIEIESMSFSKPFMEPLKEQEIQKMDISMPYNGTFIDLNEIVKRLEKEPKKIIINNIDMQKGEDTELVGNINLGVYSLSGLVETQDDALPIETTNDNNVNPFVPYKGYVDQEKVRQELEELLAQQQREQEKQEQQQQEQQQQNNNNNSSGSVSDTETPGETEEDKPIDTSTYDTYTAVKGDNISYISMRYYGTVQYVDEILSLNNMVRSSILPIGKVLKLKKR